MVQNKSIANLIQDRGNKFYDPCSRTYYLFYDYIRSNRILDPIPFVSCYTVESVREGGKHRQESNNDISRRPAPNISIGEEMNGYQVCK